MIFSTKLMGYIALSIFLSLLLSTNLYSQEIKEINGNYKITPVKGESSFFDGVEAFENHWEGRAPVKSSGWKPFMRFKWFWEQRLYPNNEFPEAMELYNSFQRYTKNRKQPNLLDDTEWRHLGPDEMPTPRPNRQPSGIGRINCVAFHPTDPNKIWAGASFGGIWSSEDKGKTWTVSPSTEMLSVGISDITIAPSDPNIMYACTGDADAAGFFGVYSNYSLGVLKSIDGGQTWSFTAYNPNRNWYNLATRVIVHPTDPDQVWVATNLGIYKSSNGLNSVTNAIRHTGQYEACRDLEMHPNNPDILIGSFWNRSTGQCWISKSVDGGLNWTITTQFDNASRIELATSKVDPEYCYAIVAEQRTNISYGAFHSFLMSNNFGGDWTTMASKADTPNLLDFSPTGDGNRGQGQYDLAIATSTDNKFEVFIGGVNIWKTQNSGSQWDPNANWLGANNKPHVHADIHELEYSPEGDLYAAHDGGISMTTNGGQTWKDISDGLSVGQFYHLSSASGESAMVIAGLQDCGTHLLKDGEWKNVLGGDGMECYIDYHDNSYMYGSLYHGDFKRSTDGGDTWYNMLDSSTTHEPAAWVAPFVIDPKNPEILYAAYINIWQSTNRGLEWHKISNFSPESHYFRELAVAPSKREVMYASIGNILIRTIDAWENFEVLRNNQTDPFITDIIVHPQDPYHFWITYSGYTEDMKVLEYDGNTVINYSSELPNVPVNCIYYQKGTPDRIYVGTEIGMFTKNKYKQSWDDMTGNMPRAVVSDVDIQYEDGKLRVATYGRGLWETDIITCNIEPPSVEIIQGSEEICAGDTTILFADGQYESMVWSNGEVGRKCHVTETGDYYVTVTDIKGCEASNEPISIVVHEPREMKVTIKGETTICEGDSLELSANPIGFKSFEWSTGETERSIFVKEEGEYRVKGITLDDCPSYSDWITVTVLPAPDKPEITITDGTLYSTNAPGYQWYLNDQPIDGATSNFYKPEVDGIYNVEITGPNGCTAMSDDFSYPTSVEMIQAKEFSIYPNPNPGIFNISAYLDSQGTISIEIIDNLGKSVANFNLQHSGGIFSNEIDISHLPTGFYFVKIQYGDEIISEKIIIE